MPDMTPVRILVVDDDPVILKLLQLNFEMEGFEVTTAQDGAAGLERARETIPDVVLLDVMMPRMTGHEVTSALRSDPRTSTIPIVILSAKAQSGDLEEGMRHGADDYVTKPFDPFELIARVNAVLIRHRTR